MKQLKRKISQNIEGLVRVNLEDKRLNVVIKTKRKYVLLLFKLSYKSLKVRR